MIERIQCIVVSSLGSVGLCLKGQSWDMLTELVEWDETVHETAYRTFSKVLGFRPKWKSVNCLNTLRDDNPVGYEHIFFVRIPHDAIGLSNKSLQWLTPSYRTVLETKYPKLLGPGVSSTYRRALQASRKH